MKRSTLAVITLGIILAAMLAAGFFLLEFVEWIAGGAM